MKQTNKTNNKNFDKLISTLDIKKHASIIWFILLIILYAVAYVFVMITSRAEGVIVLFGQAVPIRSFTGIFSAIDNLCVVLIVVFFKKVGFIVSMAILLIQYPLLFVTILKQNYTSVAGIFSNSLALATIILLNSNNRSIANYQNQLREQAKIDMVTGLPNHFACYDIMKMLEQRGEKFAVAYIELTSLKNITNVMGKDVGNKVLNEVATRWKNLSNEHLTGTSDYITVQDTNEFVIIITEFNSEKDIEKSLSFYSNVLKKTIVVDNCDYFIIANIGYALYPTDSQDPKTLITYANSALLESQKSGIERVRKFTKDLLNTNQQLEIERKIHYALDNDMVTFLLQPQYDMSHKISGFEALARIIDTDGSYINPGDFIPVAEQTGLIDKIDYTVFKKSVLFFDRLIKRTNTKITLSVNVSVKHLMENNFINEIKSVLCSCDVPPKQLEIEITESVLMDSTEKALDRIKEIKALGLRIAIDDFGTGFSSLSYLNRLPADTLKVDKSFIDQMNSSESSKQYVATIISIGHVMNIAVIAEGVEEQSQLETLSSIGCNFIQGFYWGKPMTSAEAEALLINGNQ